MTNILKRKTRLIIETPCIIQRRPLVAHVEPYGLEVRLKRTRHRSAITWAQIYNRAAMLAADARKPQRRPGAQ
jgi:hypothetical protein